MKVFLRSNSGLRNLNKFYRSKAICYVEGGEKSYSLDEILVEDKYTEESRDIIFWKNIFSKYSALKEVKFKSVGSKTVLLKLSSKILDQTLSNTIICMDSEYDEVNNKRLIHPNIIYSHGYSIENDIFNIDNICYIVCLNLGQNLKEVAELRGVYNYFEKTIRKYIDYDHYFFEKGETIFKRDNPNSHINIRKDEYPFLDEDTFNVKNGSIIVEEKDLIKNLSISKFCYGHLLEHYFSQVIRVCLAKHKVTAFVKNVIINQLIFNCISTFNEDQDKHYFHSLVNVSAN
ncbi:MULTISPECIES: hypothetical protein [unclassified Sphingobacterium]|uniref:hypothetical protein n=1 Tax=unclassified Sphingobacterium TaxID=2609468 RepID=UPI0025DDEE2A|nr:MULTISPECIES: hypothetical protein [unclassified Sphingobacterium]